MINSKLLILLSILFFCGVGCSNDPSIEDQMGKGNGGGVENPDPNDSDTLSHKEKAKAVYDMIQSLYKKGDLYAENFPTQGGDPNYCYLWPYVGMLSGANALYELGYDRSILDKEFSGLERYFDNRSSLPTYQAIPTSEGSSDHYYDDSAIVAIELIKAYELTGDDFYLNRAIAITDFIMSGEDARMGGGLYWFEGVSSDCTGGPNCMKAANTSAYAVYVTTMLYQITKDSRYRTFAERVYEWNYDTLRDPSDNLYWNDINIGTGQINNIKWTYNAALMIQSGIKLYEITGEQEFLNEAKATARSSFSKFTSIINGQMFYKTNDSWFNVELLSSFVQLAEYDNQADEYVTVFIKNMDYAWKNARNTDGQFFEDWSGRNEGRYQWLLHQAALIEAYGVVALYEENED